MPKNLGFLFFLPVAGSIRVAVREPGPPAADRIVAVVGVADTDHNTAVEDILRKKWEKHF